MGLNLDSTELNHGRPEAELLKIATHAFLIQSTYCILIEQQQFSYSPYMVISAGFQQQRQIPP